MGGRVWVKAFGPHPDCPGAVAQVGRPRRRGAGAAVRLAAQGHVRPAGERGGYDPAVAAWRPALWQRVLGRGDGREAPPPARTPASRAAEEASRTEVTSAFPPRRHDSDRHATARIAQNLLDSDDVDRIRRALAERCRIPATWDRSTCQVGVQGASFDGSTPGSSRHPGHHPQSMRRPPRAPDARPARPDSRSSSITLASVARRQARRRERLESLLAL